VDGGWDSDDVAPRRRNPLLVVLAALVAFSLAAGAVVIALDRTDSREVVDGRPQTIPPITAAPGPPPTDAELDAVVADISDFVAAARELEFLEPVEVALLDDEAFSARVQEDAIRDIDELEETESVLRAFGMIGPDVDLGAVLKQFLGAGVVGFYDPETGELVLRGGSLTPYVRITLAHELTHALDDQHFELDRPALDEADDETGFAFTALVEGNALRIEEEYRETLSEDEQEQARAEEAALGEGFDFSSIPAVVPQLIGFPYVFGPILLDAIEDTGDEESVNEAFRTPPVSSEQVLDPAAWLAGDAEPRVVPPPPAPSVVFDQGVLGLWGIVILLQEQLGQQEAIEAAQGWGGDWYVAWRDGDEVCQRTTIVMDTPEDLNELASALDEWAAAQADAEVDRSDDAVTISSCG
jgi:hypothetical protein